MCMYLQGAVPVRESLCRLLLMGMYTVAAFPYITFAIHTTYHLLAYIITCGVHHHSRYLYIFLWWRISETNGANIMFGTHQPLPVCGLSCFLLRGCVLPVESKLFWRFYFCDLSNFYPNHMLHLLVLERWSSGHVWFGNPRRAPGLLLLHELSSVDAQLSWTGHLEISRRYRDGLALCIMCLLVKQKSLTVWDGLTYEAEGCHIH